MNGYWNERVKCISPYVPGEQPRDRQFIKLNTNENPYPPSPKVIEAIKNAADDRLRLYPDPECTEFREAVAARYGVKTQQVFAGNGSDEILAFAFGAFFESGQKGEARGDNALPVLFPDITYSFYPVYAELWDIPYQTVPLCEDFSINTAEYKTDCGGAVFPNPNAPTGMALALDEILSLAEFLEKRKKVFIVDEAYIAFSADKSGAPGSLSVVSHINEYPNLLTVHTLSKSASLAGLRAGYAIGSEELLEGLRRMRDSFNSYTLDRLALAGAAAAVKDTQYYNEINRRVIAVREKTAKALNSMGFHVLPSQANFLFIKPPDVSAVELFAALREKGILVRHFKKNRIADFLRVSVGTDEDMDTFIKSCGEITGR
ncbi:MAG: histidinol-phosphate transaminase [Treponema sp.]|nr:histidinol-phosphate transaminase [Treponema sp.]